MDLLGFVSLSRSLADPSGSSALVAAVRWLEGTLLGTIATTIAVIAVSWVGLMMLSGRVDLRRGLTVILGCFILFGASSIVAGLQSALAGGDRLALAPPPKPRRLWPRRRPRQRGRTAILMRGRRCRRGDQRFGSSCRCRASATCAGRGRGRMARACAMRE